VEILDFTDPSPRPEAFFGSFSPASDLYSTGNLLGICLFETGIFHFGCNAGIILYLLMAGKMPFDNSIYKEESKRQNGQLLTQIPGKP